MQGTCCETPVACRWPAGVMQPTINVATKDRPRHFILSCEFVSKTAMAIGRLLSRRCFTYSVVGAESPDRTACDLFGESVESRIRTDPSPWNCIARVRFDPGRAASRQLGNQGVSQALIGRELHGIAVNWSNFGLCGVTGCSNDGRFPTLLPWGLPVADFELKFGKGDSRIQRLA